jgi:circadian clock protein KaiC
MSESDQEQFECEECGRMFDTEQGLHSHESQVHEGEQTTGEKVFFETGVEGFDSIFNRGIPEGAQVLMAGGAGSGKTIFCLQTLVHQARQGKNCLFMSFEESEEALIDHMEEFGWEAQELVDEGNLKIEKYSPFKTGRQVEAMLAQEKGELKVDVDPVVIPEDFDPDFIVLDSLTAVASAFQGGDDSYRIFIEQLFRFFEEMGVTSYMITETAQEPEEFSPTGVEEFLADGVIVMYSLKHGTTLKRAVQVIKMRGEGFSRDMNVFSISGEGITVKPDDELY